jgi:hypothetical protein
VGRHEPAKTAFSNLQAHVIADADSLAFCKTFDNGCDSRPDFVS